MPSSSHQYHFISHDLLNHSKMGLIPRMLGEFYVATEIHLVGMLAGKITGRHPAKASECTDDSLSQEGRRLIGATFGVLIVDPSGPRHLLQLAQLVGTTKDLSRD